MPVPAAPGPVLAAARSGDRSALLWALLVRLGGRIDDGVGAYDLDQLVRLMLRILHEAPLPQP